MQEEKDIVLSWDALGRMKAQAEAWQESFTQKCSRTLRETGSLGDEELCAESTELENFLYSIICKQSHFHVQGSHKSCTIVF